MYRYSQTLPGGPITLVGIIAVSFLIPGWVANALGFSAANIELVEDPVALRVELRYATQASVDSLRLLMRFTETLVQRAS